MSDTYTYANDGYIKYTQLLIYNKLLKLSAR